MGGGGGLLGTVAQGMAFGTGSAMAHRAVDGIMGPRGGGHAQESYEDGAATPASYDGYESQQSYEDGGACGFYQRDFNQCMQQNRNDAVACRNFFDLLTRCQSQQSESLSM